MSFLTIPSQEGLFTTIKTGKSVEEAIRGSSRYHEDNDDNNDEEEEDEEEDEPEGVRLIPRCSPVPRKRGASIHDETAEYMRIHQALSGAVKRVLFADTTGGDLVDVREFVAFDSDDEEASARWEEEEAKYRKVGREPIYNVQPEFRAPVGTALLQAVRSRKVEVEQVAPMEDEPLAFTGLIRVLNVSFHKAVYIRSTMDSWGTYYDQPAEYVQGSNDGDTDRFSFKLSFAPPYITHGSRIEFVVRYETSDGDFWANNSSMNYVLTLLLSYEDEAAVKETSEQEVRGILRAPKVYSLNNEFDSEDEQEKEEEETSRSRLDRPSPLSPVIAQPLIDIETTADPPAPSVPPNHELPSVNGTPSAHAESPDDRFPLTSSETRLHTNSSFEPGASESVQPNMSQPLPRLHCDSGDQTSEQPVVVSPSPPLQGSRSDGSRADEEEIILPQESLPSTESDLCPTGEDTSAESLETLPCPELDEAFEQEAPMGLQSELAEAGSSESSLEECEEATPVSASPVVEREEEEEAEEVEAPPSPVLTENGPVSTGEPEAKPDPEPPSIPESPESTEDAPQNSPDTSAMDPPNTSLEATPPPPRTNRKLIPSLVFLSAVVSLSVVLQQPAVLLFIGLLAVVHRL